MEKVGGEKLHSNDGKGRSELPVRRVVAFRVLKNRVAVQ